MQEWDEYWSKDQTTHNNIYNYVAVFYRKFIIKPYLKQYFNKYFSNKSIILHAGCGSGEVEKSVGDPTTIIGMDISRNALALYNKYHDGASLILGNILSIGIKNETLDGIYNLGVMEHFNENEIDIILHEFHRILKKNGVILIFWPPKYGLTVIVLRLGHIFLNSVLRKNIQLHPPEPSLITSRIHIEKIVRKAGFNLIEINFSPADAYTYMVVVMEKVDWL